MSTFNGFGTSFYGWRHFPDGTSTATRWVSFFFLPIIPLARMNLCVLTDFRGEKFFPKPAKSTKPPVLPLIKLGVVTQEDSYQLLRKLPLSGSEILMTYFRTFVLMPLAMLWPLGVIFAGASIAKARNISGDEMWFTWVSMLLILGAIANILCVAIWAIRRSRGMGSHSAIASLGPRT